MAISFIDKVSAAAATATLPTTIQAGDYIVVYAYRGNQIAAPTLAAGYTSLFTQASNSTACQAAYKVAVAGDSGGSLGTWTNADWVIAVIYRGVTGIGAAPTSQTNTTGTTTTVPGIATFSNTSGTSWVVSFGGSNQNTSMTTPTGSTLRSSITNAGNVDMGIAFDSNGGVTTWGQHTSTNGASGFSNGGSVELLSTGLQIDATSPAYISTTSASTVTSASFTAPSGALLVALAAHDTTSANTTNTSVVTDSGGLSWTKAATMSRQAGSTIDGHVQVSWAVTSSAVARTVTTTGTNTIAGTGLQVLVFTGAATSAPLTTATGSSSAAAVSKAITTTAANSWVWLVNDDWGTQAVPTAGTNQATHAGSVIGTTITMWIDKQLAVTAANGTSVTMNSTAPTTSTANNFIAFAVAPSSGTTASTHFLTLLGVGA